MSTPELQRENPVIPVPQSTVKTVEKIVDTDSNTKESITIKSGVFTNTSIDAIRENIRNQEKSRAESKKELTIESIQTVWSEYIEAISSKSVQLALQLIKISIKNKTIEIAVPTQVNKDMILQESNLLERLRDELLIPDLIFDIQINIAHFPDYKESKFVPTLSQKDKFVLMVEKNSKLETFTHKFGLKLDTGG